MIDRIKAIADAATTLFLQQGYSKTQISHIAKAVGVSVGTIYLDFTGKQAIMHFVLKCTIDPDFINNDFQRPITDSLFAGLEHDIVALFEQTEQDFAKHLANSASDYSLEALVSDAFDLLAQYAVGCLFIEKNQFDFDYLAAHYKNYRNNFYESMSRYLTAFVANGTVRSLEHIDLTTMLIIEMLSWWAMDMRYTSFETQDISLSLAKKICLDNIVTAYQNKNQRAVNSPFNYTYTDVMGNLSLFNKNDNIDLTIPKDLAFEFEATSKNGAISTTFEGDMKVEERTTRGTVGDNPAVTITTKTNNGDIQVTQ